MPIFDFEYVGEDGVTRKDQGVKANSLAEALDLARGFGREPINLRERQLPKFDKMVKPLKGDWKTYIPLIKQIKDSVGGDLSKLHPNDLGMLESLESKYAKTMESTLPTPGEDSQGKKGISFGGMKGFDVFVGSVPPPTDEYGADEYGQGGNEEQEPAQKFKSSRKQTKIAPPNYVVNQPALPTPRGPVPKTQMGPTPGSGKQTILSNVPLTPPLGPLPTPTPPTPVPPGTPPPGTPPTPTPPGTPPPGTPPTPVPPGNPSAKPSHVKKKDTFGGYGEAVDKMGEMGNVAVLAARASAGDPTAMVELAMKAKEKIDEKVESLKQMGMEGINAFKGQTVGEVGGSVGRGIEQFGKATGLDPIEKAGKFVTFLAESVDSIRDFANHLHDSNMRFAEFSASMARVQAEQEVREIYLGAVRGERRADTAKELAESKFAFDKAMAPLEDKWANFQNTVMAKVLDHMTTLAEGVKEILKRMGVDIPEEKGPEGTGLHDWMAGNVPSYFEKFGRPDRF